MNHYYPISPLRIVIALIRDLPLICQLSRREIASRYRGSFLGIIWSFVTPLMMLAIYSFVFTVVFKSRWPQGTGVRGEYAVILFAGLVIHTFLAECLSRAPTIILSNPNFVKRVVFPLEVLVPTAVASALFQLMISMAVVLAAYIVVFHQLLWTVVFIPVILAPLIIFSLGICWFLAALGVYLRDIPQVMSVVITVLLFTSPVLFPVSSLPVPFQPWIFLNPLSLIVEQVRGSLLAGDIPNWHHLGAYTLVSLIVSWCGFFFFQKTRKGFADVI